MTCSMCIQLPGLHHHKHDTKPVISQNLRRPAAVLGSSAGNLVTCRTYSCHRSAVGTGAVQGVHCEVSGAERNCDGAGGQRHRRGSCGIKATLVASREGCYIVGNALTFSVTHLVWISKWEGRKGFIAAATPAGLIGCIISELVVPLTSPTQGVASSVSNGGITLPHLEQSGWRA